MSDPEENDGIDETIEDPIEDGETGETDSPTDTGEDHSYKELMY